jgi:hypothetical protein
MSLFVNHRSAPEEPYSRYAAAEVGAAMSWSTQTAQKRLNLAYQLDTVLTRTHTAMGWGDLDLTKAQALADMVAPLDDDKARQVEARVLPDVRDHTIRWLREKARKAIAELDPDGENERRKKQVKHRRVEKQPADHGMSWLSGYIPAEKAEAIYRRIDAIAHSRRTREDPRSIDELRADVFVDLLLGERSNVATKIEVRVDALTLAGLDNKPGYLSGYGPLTADHVREFAFDPDSVWYRILTDPISGIVVDHGRTRYRPTAALRDLVKARDQRCTFKDCYRPATSCELDHNIPYPQGKTSDDNLNDKCDYHHHCKDHGWHSYQYAPGCTVWTSPTGRKYVTTPDTDRTPPQPPEELLQ